MTAAAAAAGVAATVPLLRRVATFFFLFARICDLWCFGANGAALFY